MWKVTILIRDCLNSWTTCYTVRQYLIPKEGDCVGVSQERVGVFLTIKLTCSNSQEQPSAFSYCWAEDAIHSSLTSTGTKWVANLFSASTLIRFMQCMTGKVIGWVFLLCGPPCHQPAGKTSANHSTALGTGCAWYQLSDAWSGPFLKLHSLTSQVQSIVTFPLLPKKIIIVRKLSSCQHLLRGKFFYSGFIFFYSFIQDCFLCFLFL